MYDEFLETFQSERIIDTSDYALRLAIFEETLKGIIEHNQNPANTWKKGISAYTDMTEEEFMEYFHLNVRDEQQCSATASPIKSYNVGVPSNFDWRNVEKTVTPVKNQRNCGSCWTFSTIGAMESHYWLATKTSGNFSEQQLVDCVGKDYDCYGCRGGLPSYAFNYIKDHGLTDEDTYEYTAKDEVCYFEPKMSVVTTDGPFNITAYNETQLTESLYHEGPISVAFQVVAGFKDYASGVYHSDVCKNGPMDVNHAVLAVGYGVDGSSNLPFYSIKNSWGDSWGNKGFFNIERGVDMCGIGVCNSYPINVHPYTPRKLEMFLKDM